MAKLKVSGFDDPFLYFKVDNVSYCWNPEYGSLLNLDSNELESPTTEMAAFIKRYYETVESLGDVENFMDRLEATLRR